MKLNKLTYVLAAMGLAVGSASAIDLWTAGDGAQVSTGGYWYGYDDGKDSGSSTWTCNGTLGYDDFEDFAGECMAADDLKVDFSISADASCGDDCTYGFAGVGFNLGEDIDGVKETVPLTQYAGITVTYSTTNDIKVQIADDEAALKYDTHTAKLRASATSKTLTWSNFKQAGWGTDAAIADIVASAKEIKFQAHSENGVGAGTFSVSKITLDGGATAVASFGDFNYSVAGEALVFNGLEKSMNVEIFDLQGKMVKAADLSAASNAFLKSLNFHILCK